MPNRSSLLRRLTELRRCYTGETDSSVVPAISQGLHGLDTHDRAQLLEVLDHNYVTRLMGEPSHVRLPTRIRHAVLPHAATPAQQELEACVLAAASRAVNHLLLRPPADLSRPARIFRMVRSLPDDLVIHLEPLALAPLLAELLPKTVNDDIQGVPGLRVKPHRRHLELHLIDTDTTAMVLLATTSHRQWTAALAYIDAACPGTPVTSDSLTQLENNVLATRHRTPGAAATLTNAGRSGTTRSAHRRYVPSRVASRGE
jgi:hypothetical protein